MTWIPFLCGLVVATGSAVAWGQAESTAEEPLGPPAGQRIYTDQCASCHGEAGQGGDGFSDPLIGDLSESELARYIEETMPEGEPGLVAGADAKQVAQYVFGAFYSEDARRRNNQPRIELARRTVPQFRNAVADLVASFQTPTSVPETNGLRARYYAARRQTKSRQISEQIDPLLDFGEGVPHFDPTGKYESVAKPEKKPANQMNVGFSAYWTGGLLAPRTGEYRFKVRSKNGFKLYINDPETPLIDRQVRSDEIVDHEASIFLPGGRMVGLRLDLFSYPDPPARLELLWTPPGEPEALVPPWALKPESTPEVLIVDTPFPADDASAGYERGTDVSAEWDRSVTEASIEAAQWIASRIRRLAGYRAGDDNATAKARAFCETLVARAFANRLTDRDRELYIGQHFDQPLSIEDQVKRVVLMTLKSPRFLFPAIEPRDQNFRIASQMAEAVWDSIPDPLLWQAADRGELVDPKQRQKHVRRMVHDFRGRQKLDSFFTSWLAGHRDASAKDETRFPDFDHLLVADLRTSLRQTLQDIAWSEESDYRQLLLADYLMVNRRVADFYGLNSEQEIPDHQFVRVSVDPRQRSGILTHPYLLAELAYHTESSPIHRGVFVAKRLLGRRLRQPPNNVKPLTEAFAPEMTTRERVEHQTREPTCMNCHSVINPLGFSLENFDAVGRFRWQDEDRKIDASASYRTRDGETVDFNGARDLASFLVQDARTEQHFIRQLFRYYVKQPVDAYGIDRIDDLHRQFVDRNYNIRDLILAISESVIELKDSTEPTTSSHP